MAHVLVDGNTRVDWVPTIANLGAPTVAELTAGMNLSHILTADGLQGFQPDTAAVDTSALASTFNTAAPGRASFSGQALRLKKQPGSDTTFTTLVRGTTGFIVIRRGVDADTAYAAANKVAVYPSQCGTRKDLDPEANSVQRYDVPVFLTDEPKLDAVVAA
ncbi:MAG: hypothetical protein ACJ74O_13505 [Frankiaceae bacterium]|jgi:hypothetical protein